MPACSRCLVEVFPGTAICPSCGAAIRPGVVRRPAPKKVGRSRQRFNTLEARERITGPANVVLLLAFWMPWYSIGPFSVDGLRAHGWLFTAVLSAIVLVLYAVFTAFGVGDLADPFRMSKEQLLTLLPGVNLVLVALAFLLKPTGLSWSWGALVALAAAIVAFLPYGIPYIKERRQH